MFRENELLNKLLAYGRAVIPRRFFKLAQPFYHRGLAVLGAIIYGFPSRAVKIIAVTGTKGKSTTVYMISKIFEDQGLPVAAIGSLGLKIKSQTWPNTLKMTLPGRFKLQKFLYRVRQNFLTSASSAGDKKSKNLGGQVKKDTLGYVILEATSEGIAQHRLAGVKIDCAVFTNLHREHLESHGSFEKYTAAKQKLFLRTSRAHVLNIDDPYFEKFANFPAKLKLTYGRKWGLITPLKEPISNLNLRLIGDFNVSNALAALSVASVYNLDLERAVVSLNAIESIPGRMEIVHSPKGFDVVIDYAHTPDSLRLVYQTLWNRLPRADSQPPTKLICVLGAAGGGRDKWKRPEFGKIAARYCDEVILTDEDPYDENPATIIEDIEVGFSSISNLPSPLSNEKHKQPNYQKILDRREALKKALVSARPGDIVAVTGKGSETSMAIAGGKKIPWSDKKIVEELLRG